MLKSGRIKEWMTSEELERVINNPSEYFTQALLVGSRILPARSFFALRKFIEPLFSITNPHNYTSNYTVTIHQKLNILWLILETIRGFDVGERFLWRTTLEVVNGLIPILLELRSDNVDPLIITTRR